MLNPLSHASPRWTLAVTIASLVASGCNHGDTGTVAGQLKKSDGGPLVGAKVIIRNPDTGFSAFGTTDEQGEFTLKSHEMNERIPAESYRVVILEDEGNWDDPSPPTIAAKYQSPNSTDIELQLTPGEAKNLDLTLDPR